MKPFLSPLEHRDVSVRRRPADERRSRAVARRRIAGDSNIAMLQTRATYEDLLFFFFFPPGRRFGQWRARRSRRLIRLLPIARTRLIFVEFFYASLDGLPSTTVEADLREHAAAIPLDIVP